MNKTDSGVGDAVIRRTPWTLVRETAWDIAIGLFWAALIVAIVLFSGVATQFAYVDF